MRRARCGVASRRATDLDTYVRPRRLVGRPISASRARATPKSEKGGFGSAELAAGGTEPRALTAPRLSRVRGVDRAAAMNDFESMDLDGDGTLSYAVRVRAPRPRNIRPIPLRAPRPFPR